MPTGNPGQPRPERRGERHKSSARMPRTRDHIAGSAPTVNLASPRVLNDLEHQVARLIADGRGDREIAQVLRMHPADVVKVDLRIRLKFGISSRGQVAVAMRTEA